jgi:AcrR family transcriptional regulator
MTDILTKTGGLRERKKQETLLRIAETGLKLFVRYGYEGVTLDEIASEAGISRRTFFYYFKSKEAILLKYLDGGFAKAIKPILLAQPTDQGAFKATCDSIIQLMSKYDSEEAIAVMNLLGSTEALRARMPGVFVDMERAVFDTLCELWPEAERRASLRMVAMVSIGAMRIAKEAWLQAAGKRPLSDYLRESFDTVEKTI